MQLVIMNVIARLRNHNATDDDNVDFRSFNPILDGGGGKFAPPASLFNIAQKPLGLGS